MNKYLKILMLSGGLVGAIAPTAIDIDNNNTDDLKGIYEQVEKMQNIVPKLSRINYKVNINTDEFSNESVIVDDISLTETNVTGEHINNSDLNDYSTTINEQEDNANLNNKSTNNNISFSATDSNGTEQLLNKDETINYLNETLIQTNIEYEELRKTLTNAIKDTMDYLDSYKNGDITLTNEQKIYIKEHSNSIKYLAETLEDLSEDLICCIDGCDDCDDENFELKASQYLSTINNLENRINTLNKAIESLQFINNIGNPYLFNRYVSRNHLINPNNTQENDTNTEDNTAIEVEQSNNEQTKDTTTNSVDNNLNTQYNVEENNNDLNIENSSNDEKPTTFGLKSNIDTYAPTKRNIDTFFNTALYDNEYMNGYGYGMPPYGYGTGYNMPYGQGYYGQPYGNMGYNSNLINRSVVENQYNNEQTDNSNQNNNTDKTKRIRVKRAKNIDTYNDTTLQSNINTMGESKISKFFKEKFNNLRNKVRKQQDEVESNNSNTSIVKDEKVESNINKDLINNDNSTIDNSLVKNTTDLKDNISSNDSPIKQEQDIKAR